MIRLYEWLVYNILRDCTCVCNVHWVVVFSRVTSVNRVTLQSGASSDNSSTDQFCVIGLIQHLNLNAARLQQILQGLCLLY